MQTLYLYSATKIKKIATNPKLILVFYIKLKSIGLSAYFMGIKKVAKTSWLYIPIKKMKYSVFLSVYKWVRAVYFMIIQQVVCHLRRIQ